MELIAQGTAASEIQNLNQYDPYFNEGDFQVLQIRFAVPQAAGIAGWIEQGLIDRGVTEWKRVRVEGDLMTLEARMGNPFPWAILIAVLGVLAIVAIIAWALYRITDVAIGVNTTAGQLVLWGGVLLAGYYALKALV